MLKIICLSNNINIIRVNIIVFFSLFLLLGFQCLFDFLNDDISEINNIKKYAILFIIISIIGILSTCLIWEDKENSYRVKDQVEYIVFPNSKVGIGQRAGIMLRLVNMGETPTSPILH
jgi:hypothetical protein